ncbi:MAG: DUF1996 domain-containing protein [Chloroflexota bacterium]
MRFLGRWFLALSLTTLWMPGTVMAEPAGQRRGMADGPPAVGSEHELGVFRTVCRYSHSRRDDPIVSPLRFGASHLHDFFGNVTTAADSTAESLLASDTSCVTAEDRSAYWVPALSRDGEPVTPTSITVYYRGTLQDGDRIASFPAGFRMIAGDASATGAPSREVVAWSCRQANGPSSFGGSPPTCPSDSALNLHIRFPSCWDGTNIDSADHKSHMAYDERGRCPASHATHVPRVAMIVHYPITGEPGQISLSSGAVHTAHADFFNAWQPDFLASKVDACLNQETFCGTLLTAGRRGAARAR